MLKTVPKTENTRKRRLQRLFFCPFAGSRQHLDHQVLSLFSAGKLVKGGLFQLKPEKTPPNQPRRRKPEKTPPNQPRRRGPNFARILYMGYLCVCLSVCFASPASAATIWEKASEIMQDVYTQILTISTIAAIVTASVALLMMNFSRSGRTVEESRAWLKRIIITWVILNGLGFIMAYVTPFFQGGQWTPSSP